MVLANKVIYQNGAIREFEKPEVCEAIKVANANRWTVGLSPIEWYEREARLKKELEEHANAPVSGKEKAKKGNPALKEAASQFNDALLDEQAKQIDEQNKEITRLLSLVEKKENSISRLYYEKSVLEKENEDLKKGEIPARYFDKALVDEQAEKIKKLEHEKLDILEIASSSKQTIAEQAKKIKRLGKEISKLNIIIHDKNAVLSDVAEELRLTKIREKNLAELGLKYVGENEKLKKELADKVIDKIDARALKSAESALAYKEKVIAEKDDVIADLGKELAAQKDLVDDISLKYDGAKYNLKLRMDECEKLKKQLDSNTKMVQKMAEIIVHKKPVTADVFKKCCIMAYNEEKLSKVLDDVIDQFLLFGEIIIKEEK